jgi:hypothetical protein
MARCEPKPAGLAPLSLTSAPPVLLLFANRYWQFAYFFLAAIGRAGPFRVRALVWVRWPRTGRPRR